MAGPWDALGQGLSRAAGNINARRDRELEAQRLREQARIQDEQNRLRAREEEGRNTRSLQLPPTPDDPYWRATLDGTEYKAHKDQFPTYGEFWEDAKRQYLEATNLARELQGGRSETPEALKASIWREDGTLDTEALYFFGQQTYAGGMNRQLGIEDLSLALMNPEQRETVLEALAWQAAQLAGPHAIEDRYRMIREALGRQFAGGGPPPGQDSGPPPFTGGGPGARLPDYQVDPGTVLPTYIQPSPEKAVEADLGGIPLSPTPPPPGTLAPREEHYYQTALEDIERELAAAESAPDGLVDKLRIWNLERQRSQLRRKLQIE